MRRNSIINLVKRRLVKRRTKSDQFLEVRNMANKDVVAEMDIFFNELSQVSERYRTMRKELVPNQSIKLLQEIAKVKKKFIRAVTLVRTWRDSLPKYEELKNLRLANKLYTSGYEEQAFTMCKELGVNYSDYFQPFKKRMPIIRERKSSLVNKEVIRQLELSFAMKNKKLPIPKGVPKKTYYFHIDAIGNFAVHIRVLDKEKWAATHYLYCVPSPLNIISIDPENPQVGQVARAKTGEYVLIARKSKRDFERVFKFETKDAEAKKRKILARNLKEKKRLAAARELKFAEERAALKEKKREAKLAAAKKKNVKKLKEKRMLASLEKKMLILKQERENQSNSIDIINKRKR